MEKMWQVADLSWFVWFLWTAWKTTPEFCLEQTQQIKQDQMIYAIIITTDLNKEDENIKEIIERHLRKKIPEIRGICFNCSRDMLQLFLLQLFPERD